MNCLHILAVAITVAMAAPNDGNTKNPQASLYGFSLEHRAGNIYIVKFQIIDI